MKKNFITIDGNRYPCYATMGALVKFEKETGRTVQELRADSISDMVTLLWCQVYSACRREKVEFTYTVEDFADAVDQVAFTDWVNSCAEEADEVSEEDKKKAPSL